MILLSFRCIFSSAPRSTKLIYFHMNRTESCAARGVVQGGVAGTDLVEPNRTELNWKRTGMEWNRTEAERAECNEHLHNAQEWFSVSFGCNRVCCLLLISMCAGIWVCVSVCVYVYGILHVLCHIAPFAWMSVSIGGPFWCASVCVCMHRVRLQFDLS